MRHCEILSRHVSRYTWLTFSMKDDSLPKKAPPRKIVFCRICKAYSTYDLKKVATFFRKFTTPRGVMITALES